MKYLFAASALCMIGTSAWAQAASTTPPAATGSKIEEVVVTAQRRSENLQQVPIAITATGGAQLKSIGVSDTQQLTMVTPGLSIRTTVGAFQPYIRGVGTSASIVENPVALYIDGVYLPQQREGVRELNDIEQVAVLKGPQGTLFGRNSTGGVVQITTKAPRHDFSGEVNARVESYDTVHGDVYMTGGITDQIAGSISAEYTRQGEGWGKDYSTGSDTYQLLHQYGARGKLLIQPSDSTDITVIADYMDRLQRASSFQPYPGSQFGFFGAVGPNGKVIQPCPVQSVYDTCGGLDGRLGFKGGGASVTVDQKLSFAKLVSITSYRHDNGTFAFDNSGVSPSLQTTQSYRQPSTSYSEELQLMSNQKSPLRWVTGIYYFHYLNAANDILRFRQAPIPGPVISYTQGQEITESVAPFAQVDWEFLPQTTLTVGARYTYEKRNLTGTFNPATSLTNPVVGPPVKAQELTVEKPTYRVALSHNFNPDLLVYASYNFGFKSGGFNILSPTNPAYLPEELTAYETGIKSELFDRRLRLNAAGFYYKYTNIQVNQITPAGQVIVNGPGAELYGLDVDMEARITDNLRVSGGLELEHSEFTSYPNAIKNLSFPAKGAVVGTGDATGKRLPLQQNVSGTLAIDYDTNFGFGPLHFNASANFNGQYYFEADNYLKQPAYTLINTSVRWDVPRSKVSLSLWGKNLGDEHVITQTSSQNGVGFPTAYGSPPRTYGVTVQAKF